MIRDPVYWIALGAVVIVYWSIAASYRRIFLAVVGLGVILYFDPLSAAFVIVMAALVYVVLPYITGGRHAGLATVAIIATLVTPLLLFKSGIVLDILRAETTIDAGDLIVPLGMSYYVFRLTHVLIDAYRTERVSFSLGDYVTYIFLFTIFPAGPIQRLDLFLREQPGIDFQPDHILHGLSRICIGFIKQVVMLDYLLRARDELTAAPVGQATLLTLQTASYTDLWLILAMAYLASLLNLSAYTDLAIGSSRLLGFKITENFNYPFIATSLTDFWRRWHITLSNWCQTYVYAPVLGWSRNPYIALLMSFQVMGLWHVLSVNRMSWGLFHAAGVIIASLHQKFVRRRGIKWADTIPALVAYWVLTQAFVCASWIFVIAEKDADYLGAWKIVTRLFLG